MPAVLNPAFVDGEEIGEQHTSQNFSLAVPGGFDAGMSEIRARQATTLDESRPKLGFSSLWADGAITKHLPS